MSWIEKVQQDLIITTADGKEHRPMYINASKVREYNVSEFEYVDVMGTYVPRKMPKGRKLNLELIFQGDNHLDTAEALETSTDNSTGPWRLQHPLYGFLLVQPTSIAYDNSADLNSTRVICSVIETITLEFVNEISQSPASRINTTSESIYTDLVNTISVTAPKIDVSERQSLINSLQQSYSNVAKWVTNTADANNYLNEFNASLAIINKVSSPTVDIARGVQRFTTLPYAFDDNITNRIRIFKTQVSIIKQSAGNLFKRNSKKLAELQLSNILTASAQATITEASYENADDVENVLGDILDIFEDYIETLDQMSTDNETSEDSYQPEYDTVTRIRMLVSFVNEVLLSVVQNARIRRIYRVPEDMTLYELVHRIYGLDAEDVNLNRIINDNRLPIQELYILPKDKEIVYYK